MSYLGALRTLLQGLSTNDDGLILDACEQFVDLLQPEREAIPISTRLLAQSLLNSTPEQETQYWWTTSENIVDRKEDE